MDFELRPHSCLVREFRPDDAASLARHGNNRKVWLNLRDLFPHPYTEAHAAGYIAHVRMRPEILSFAIEVGGEAVGGISLRRGEDIERFTAELGYWLGEEFWGRGITTDAIEQVTGRGLGAHGLIRIFAVPFTRNVAPRPSALSTVIVPPTACTIASALVRPRPVPSPGGLSV